MNKLASWLGLEGEKEELDGKCTGLTTGIAFRTIGEAMTRPNTRVRIVDHHPDRRTDLLLARMIEDIVLDNNLQFLEITNEGYRYYLTYNVFEDTVDEV